jgi:A/G-specific adenine glycosylase
VKFLALWPRVEDLAAAPTEAVMQAWAGLGYYSRARNLLACAQIVARDFGGKFPADEAQLLRLPGIGPYTAAAIASIAFGQRAVVVDGNVERVATRLLALETPLPEAKAAIKTFWASQTPQQRAGDFAQAAMDLGATLCAPRSPNCLLCPLRENCAASAAGNPQNFPRKAPKKPRPTRRGVVFYLRRADGAVLVRRRPPRGLLGGMTEFFGTDWRENAPENALAAAPPAQDPWRRAGAIDHVFTHFALTLDVYVASGEFAPDGGFFLSSKEMETAALPSLMRKVENCAKDALCDAL